MKQEGQKKTKYAVMTTLWYNGMCPHCNSVGLGSIPDQARIRIGQDADTVAM